MRQLLSRRASRASAVPSLALALLFALSASSVGRAQTSDASRTSEAPATAAPAPAMRTVLTAARIFDATTANTRPNGVVIVENGRIVDAGSGLAVPAAGPGVTVIDLGDATLLPGLMDAHVHLTGEIGASWSQDFVDDLLRFPAEQAFYAASYAKKTLEAGFTTVRNLGAADYVDVGLRNAINKGLIPGPRMLVAVYALGPTGGHGDGTPFPPGRVPQDGPVNGVCNGAEECRKAVRFQIKYGADVIKFMPSGGVLSLSDTVDAPQMTAAEIEAIVDEAHNWGRKAAAHCHGDIAARMAIAAGVDSLEHGSFIKADTLQLMKDKGVYLVPTLLAGEWTGGQADKFPPAIAAKARAALAARSQMFQSALKIGVKIAFGTDSAVSPHGLNGKEFALMTGLGMSPGAALRSATAVDADLLGVADRLGTLEKGKIADVVAVAGDPLQNIATMEKPLLVMKDGVIVVRASN
ncbi:MAG: amidohydrolase family protein [Thermoanaerobaculia bacterium]